MGNSHSSSLYVEPLAPQALPATQSEITYACMSTGKQVFSSPMMGSVDFSRASSADTAAVMARDRSGLSSTVCSPLTSPGAGPSVPTATAVPISWEQASKMVHAEGVAVCWSLRTWLDSLEMPGRDVMERCAKESTRRAPMEHLLRVEEADTESMSSWSSGGGEGEQHVRWGVGRSKGEEELDCHHHDELDAQCMLLEGCPAW